MKLFLLLFATSVSFFSFRVESKEYETFVYLRGNAEEKKAVDNFTLMTWNVCALPFGLSTTFGGVRPAKERVNEIVDFIASHDPDIICFQEAHDLSFSYELFEKLKEVYSHFVLDIGRISFTQLNSGLLVISKLPISNFYFKEFEFDHMSFQKAIKKGFFAFKVSSNHQELAHVITTHLQPYKTEIDALIRLHELQLIVDALRENTSPGFKIVCGDLNIDRIPPKEFGRERIEAEFFDPLYPPNSLPIPTTATNYLTYAWHAKNPVPKEYFEAESDESIDYCIIWNAKNHANISAELLTGYYNRLPKRSLSDHHAILTTFRLNPVKLSVSDSL